MLQLSRCHLFFSRLPLLPGTLSPISTKSIIQQWVTMYTQVFQPCSVLWYLPKICSRISQICLCISVSKSLRWSRNIAMMSRWFALRRTSSSNGKSHSKRTSKVCISRKTLVTFSNPIIQPMYCSSIASRNGRLSRRLSILSTDRMAILFFVHRYLSQTRTNNKLVQTHPLCLQDLLQPQSVSQNQLAYFSLLISRQVVGVLTVQTPHLCLQDLLPTSSCRDTPSISKTCHLRQSIDKSPSTNDLTANMPQK